MTGRGVTAPPALQIAGGSATQAGVDFAEETGSSHKAMSVPTHNPFSASKIACPEVFVEPAPPNPPLPSVVSRWERSGYVGQIVGPHGCGKSTLAIALATAAGASAIRHCVVRRDGSLIRAVDSEHPGMDDRYISVESPFMDSILDLIAAAPKPDLSADRERDGAETEFASPSEVWIVDGLTQWSVFHSWMIRRICRRRNVGLLLTTHTPISFVSILVQLQPTCSQFCRIATAMLDAWAAQNTAPELLTSDDFRQVYKRHNHDYRESLMELYDVYARRSAGMATEKPGRRTTGGRSA